MTIPIPLLDRSSAVGDEGRPRAASLAVASFVVALLVVAGGFVIGQPDLLVSLGSVTGLAGAGLALLDRERFVHLLAGHCLFVWFGAPLSLLVVFAPLVGRVGVAVDGFALALFGLAMTWGNAGTRTHLGDGLSASTLAFAATILWLVGFAAVAGGLALAELSVEGLVGQSTAAGGLASLFVVVAYAGAGIAAAIRWLPIRQLTPRSRRPAVERRVAVIRRYALGTIAVAVLSLLAVSLIRASGGFERLEGTALATGFGALSSPLVVWPAVTVGTVGILAGAVALTLRRLARDSDPASAERLAAVIAGFVLAVAAVVAAALVAVSPLVGAIVFLGVLAAPLALVVCIAILVLGIDIGILPDRASGAAMAAFGLVVSAVGFARISMPVTFACVAVALLVWDLSSFGLGVTAELGRIPETRRLELVHAVVGVGITVAVVVALVAVDALRTGVFAGVGGTVPAVVACLGALALLGTLRG
ncbi:hypothetical protein [Natronomonas gomsonensis]|uniref:hypothetical protein n=1 Tax=Natronomonas gomsonensis TaxID=1046043 RepID=UPI0015BBDD6E|nr:hypothetical protein [Natronomonas gomsonensis]